MSYQLPQLPYAYDALEPYLDKQTLEIHHQKHHQAYTDKTNAILEKYPQLAEQKAEELMQNLLACGLTEADQLAFRNQGGGYINHSFFWTIISPKKEIDSSLVKEVEAKFGSIELFKEKFTALAISHFGSGWTWLVRDQNSTLQLYNTANQDSPYLQGHTPLICIDLWEHSYYLKYQNRRAEYITNWWSVVKSI